MTQHPEIPTLLKTPVVVARLGSADYAFLDSHDEPVGIERCEIGNLMQKIRNGELESQLIRCDEDYSTVILLVEGVFDESAGLVAHYRKSREGTAYFRSRIEPFFKWVEVQSTLIRLSELGIEIMETPNFGCSMLLIDTIYKQRTKPEESHQMFKRIRSIKIPVKLSANPAVPMLMSLCPRLPEKTAILLINKYGSIWNILNTPIPDLMETDGVGRGLVTKLFTGVGKV